MQDKEDWINSIGRAIVRHSKRWPTALCLCNGCYHSLTVCDIDQVLHAVCWTMIKATTQITCSSLLMGKKQVSASTVASNKLSCQLLSWPAPMAAQTGCQAECHCNRKQSDQFGSWLAWTLKCSALYLKQIISQRDHWLDTDYIKILSYIKKNPEGDIVWQ